MLHFVNAQQLELRTQKHTKCLQNQVDSDKIL